MGNSNNLPISEKNQVSEIVNENTIEQNNATHKQIEKNIAMQGNKKSRISEIIKEEKLSPTSTIASTEDDDEENEDEPVIDLGSDSASDNKFSSFIDNYSCKKNLVFSSLSSIHTSIDEKPYDSTINNSNPMVKSINLKNSEYFQKLREVTS